jgi:hypothetical protein
MRKRPGLGICLMILSTCLFTTCELNRTQTSGFTSVPAMLTPAASVPAQPYPVVTPVNTQSVLPYPNPRLLQMTLAAGTRNAYIASLDKTLTAVPTATSTPTFPVDALPCHASALQISARTDGYPTYLEFIVKITNISKSTCYLQGPPDI